MRLIIRTGSRRATALTNSTSAAAPLPPVAGRASSNIRAVSSRAAPVQPSMLRRVKLRDTMRRSPVCSGGSVSSIVRRASRASGSRSNSSNSVPPTCEENVWWSRWTVTRSAQRVTAQNPALPSGSSCQATGISRRRRANASCGMASS